MNKYKILALFGPSGSGKDTIAKYIVEHYPSQTSAIVSCTTRPKRDYEKNKVDYYFLTNEEFTSYVLNGEMLEATEFRHWFYGTPLWALSTDTINIGVFNPEGIEILLEDPRIDLIPVEVLASDKIRLIRSLNREKNPDCEEICRRFFTDKKDFDNILFESKKLNNENDIPVEEIEKLIKDLAYCDQND